MIYFDNAATTFYKPPQVIDCVLKSLNNPANANRGSHSLSVAATAQITEVRNKVARMVNLSDPLNVAFSQNCTSALNLAIGEREKARVSRRDKRSRAQFRASSPFRAKTARHNFPFRACARQRKPSDGAGRSKCLQQGYAAGCFKPRKQRGRFRKRRRFNRRPVQAGGRNFYRGRGAIRRLHRNRYAADENRPVGFPGAQGTARHSGLRLPLLQ